MRNSVVLGLMFLLAGGCHAGKKPELRVLGVHDAVAHEVVFVQVSNPAKQAMRLTKLTYKFASAGGTIATGEMPLHRDVPAGAAVVVEVPLDSRSQQPMTLHGELTAELDQIERTYPVEAKVSAGRTQPSAPRDDKPQQQQLQGSAETSSDEPQQHPASSDDPEALEDQALEQPLEDSAEGLPYAPVTPNEEPN